MTHTRLMARKLAIASVTAAECSQRAQDRIAYTQSTTYAAQARRADALECVRNILARVQTIRKGKRNA